MDLKLLFLTTMLISEILSACGSGCSVCNTSTNTCKFCDFRNGYTLTENGTCTYAAITDCELYDPSGSCYRCKASTYLVEVTGTFSCNLVPSFITNCSYYSGPATCSQCATNYALNNNICVSVPIPITNCEVHSSTGTTCTWCKSGYIKNVSGTACNAITSIVNCRKYSLYECEECDSTKTIKNKNSYLSYSFSDEGFDYLSTMMIKYFYSYADVIMPSQCLTFALGNCKTYSTFNTCSVCNTGYYVTPTAKCSKDPLNTVPFCSIYEDYDNCSKCMENYYLVSSTQCSSVTPVNNCVEYELDADACARCPETMILNVAANTCGSRANSIPFCSVHAATTETCEVCEDNYVLTNQYLKCAEEIADCDEYKNPSLASSGDICISCIPGKYTNANYNECLTGNITDCYEYQNVTGNCIQCENDLYLESNTCVPRNDTLYECILYTTDVDGSCDTCSSSTNLFTVNQGCGQIDNKNFCISYSDVNTCSACDDGYNLKNNSCNAIPGELNCSIMVNDVCEKCNSNFDLEEDDSCKNIQDARSYSCTISSSTIGTTNECESCNENYVPYSTEEIFICLDEDVSENLQAIDNCLKTVIDDGNKYCDLCDIGYSLSQNLDECIETCDDAYSSILGYLYFNYYGTNMPLLKTCILTTDLSAFDNYDKLDTCEVSAFSIITNDKLECVKCAEGYAPIKTCPNRRVYFSNIIQSPVNIAQNFTPVDCEDSSAKTFKPANDQCKTYIQAGSNFLCQECNFGYTGPIVYDEGIQKNYINCNQQITDCDTNIILGHLSGDFEDWLIDMFGFTLAENYSCHQCTGTKIPFIHLTYFNKLTPYDLDGTTTIPSETGISGNFLECREPEAITFNIPDNNFNFPENCALGLLIVDRLLSANYTNGTVRCMACKNGFIPIITNNKYITECQPISNCDINNTENGILNSCRYCNNGHSHPYVDTESLNYSACIEIDYPTNGCDFYNIEAETCKICKKDYQFNTDQICEQLTSLCDKQGTIQSIGSQANGAADYEYSANIYLNSYGKGCYECPDSKKPFLIIEPNSFYNSLMCVESEILTAGTTYTEMSYIEYCKIYKFETPFKCLTCNEGYVLSSNGFSCYIDDNLPNCALASNDSECLTCSGGAVKINGICTNGNISGCISYAGGSSITCSQCDSGYINNSTSCDEGNIDHCDTYDNLGNCTLCESEYVLLYGYCMNLPNETNCLKGSTNTTNMTFSCSTCEDGYLISSDNDYFNDTVCIDFITTDNCIAYDEITCLECSSSYYLENGICNQRTNSVNDCTEYNKYADECETCDAGYLLEDNNTTCTELIAGIPYCATYYDDYTCLYCYSNRIVSNNTCVPMTTPVLNCSIHESENLCKACDTNYLLVTTTTNGVKTTTCNLITAKNCLTYQSASRCSGCSNFYKLTSVSGRIDCVAFTLANCEITNNTGSCKYCTYPYYASGSSCTKSNSNTDPIPNCQYLTYSSSKFYCYKCKSGFVKNITGSSATSCIADSNALVEHPNCNISAYANTCTACDRGYYFDSSTCKQCTTNTTNGCVFCNPSSINTCWMCSTGYYMGSDGLCYSMASGLQASDNITYDDDDESVSRYGIWVSIVLMLLLLKL